MYVYNLYTFIFSVNIIRSELVTFKIFKKYYDKETKTNKYNK